MCCVCFTRETCCFVFLCCVEKYKVACPCLQNRDLVLVGNLRPGPC
ncbi:unnamed protein product, partial [Staurois parvus]